MNASTCFKIAALAVSVLLASCRGQTMETPPVHPNLNMDQQNRFEGQEQNSFFTDNRSMRQPVEGTVARGNLRANTVYYQGINEDSSFVEDIPLKLTKSFLTKGQEQYNIYCTPCHGLKGDGQGIIMTGGYGYVPAPSYHQDRLRNVNDGYLYSAIANGIRNMPSYAHQVKVENRWAIVAYIRALQKSQNVPENEIKKYDIDLASLQDEYRQKQEKEEAKKEQQASSGGGGGDVSAAKGKQLAEQNACVTCHSPDGSKMTGPTWKNLYGHEAELQDGSTVTADEDYLTESIVNSTAKIVKGYQGVMPNYSYLNETEIKSLIAYIKSLSDASSEESGAQPSNEESESESSEPKSSETNETKPSSEASDQSTLKNNQAAPQTDTAQADAQNSKNENAAQPASGGQGLQLLKKYGCTSCHSIDGSPLAAPSFQGLYGSNRKLEGDSSVVADEGYLKESIQYPNAKVALGYNANMPSFRDMLTDQQMQTIVDYIKTL